MKCFRPCECLEVVKQDQKKVVTLVISFLRKVKENTYFIHKVKYFAQDFDSVHGGSCGRHISGTMISFCMVERAIDSPPYALSIARLTSETSILFFHIRHLMLTQ